MVDGRGACEGETDDAGKLVGDSPHGGWPAKESKEKNWGS